MNEKKENSKNENKQIKMKSLLERLKDDLLTKLFFLSMIFSLIGTLLILFEDFIEIKYYTNLYDYSTYYYEYVSTETEIFGPILLMAGLFLLIIFFISLIGLIISEYINYNIIKLCIILAGIVFILSIIGYLYALFSITDAYDWWLDWGFFGGFFGGLLIIILYNMILKKIDINTDKT